ncbi:MAG: transglutaminase-like domain-containing protein [Pseudomonadota bacterium]
MSALFRPAGLLKVLIVLFWTLMVFLLVQQVYLVPKVKLEEARIIPESETWMSIFFKGQKVGYSVQTFTRSDPEYIVDHKTYLRLKLLGSFQEVRTVTSARLGPSMDLKSFNFFMSAGPIRYQLTGKLQGLNLELNSMTGGYKTKSIITLQEVPRPAAALMPYLVQQGLEKGQRFQVPIFDPSTLATRLVRVTVEDEEKLRLNDQTIDTLRLRLDYFDTKSYTWVDTNGRTVKEEGLMGLSMVRTTPEEARKGLAGRAELTDVVTATSAPTNMTLKEPRRVRYLRARLKGLDFTGFDLDGDRQRFKDGVIEVEREIIPVLRDQEPPFNDPELKPFLAPTSFVQSRDAKIVAQAKKIVKDEKSVWGIASAITDWVHYNLEKRPTMSIPSAVEVLRTKVGDCNEHAVLAAALLRAMGVPTKVVVGVLYYEGRFYYHAWLEVYWGRVKTADGRLTPFWVSLDPLLGQIPADATHIRFLSGGIEKQVDMIRVIGRLEVEIMEFK